MPDGLHTIGRWTRDRARATPERIAIDDRGVVVTYRELDARAERLARALRAAGYAIGDRVATMTGNSADHVVLFFACAKAGLVLVPLSWRLAPRELAEQLEISEPALLLVETEFESLAKATLSRRRPTHPERPARGARRRGRGAVARGRHATRGIRRPSRRRRRRRAAHDLHLGHHREAEGRGAHPCQLLLDEPVVLAHRRDRARRLRARRAAAVPRRRMEHPAAARLVDGCDRRARAHVRPRPRAAPHPGAPHHDDDGRARELPVPRPASRLRAHRPVEPRAHDRRRRADAARAAAHLARAGHRTHPGLRAHRSVAERALPSRRRRARPRRIGRKAVPARRRRRRRPGHRGAPRRRGRGRAARARTVGVRRLLPRPGRDRGDARRRVAAHRRPRATRRRRLLHDRRPHQGHLHLGRRGRGARRGRGGAHDAPGRRRRRRGRASPTTAGARPVWRGSSSTAGA